MLPDKTDGMGSDGIGNILIFPECLSPSLHITDTPDTVHNCHIVSVTRFQIIKQLRMIFPQRFPFERFPVAHFYRSFRIVVGNFAVFYENTGDTIGCRSHYI